MIPSRSALAAVGAVAALAAALVAPGAAQAARPVAKAMPAPALYVSLGDSYASGFQPTAPGKGSNTRNGFAYQVPAYAAKRGWRLKLVNFGCGGATTASIITQKGCPKLALGPGGRAYPGKTQAAAAEAFLKANRGKVALITVSIGGNDVTACAKAANPVACVATAVAGIKKNVSVLVKGLRRAAGPNVRIVGTTYPDVILGTWLTGNQSLARLSIVAFQTFINPALKLEYGSVKGQFVDVTAATGAYGPLTDTTTLPPYGTIPTPVAKVCELTYFCQFGDIHSRTSGYGVIAQLVAGTLPKRGR